MGSPNEDLHHHYIFNNDDVLPIISSQVHEHGTSASRSRSTPGPSGASGAREGGFSRVERVEFHPDHYDFGPQKGEKYKVFALKKLNAPDQANFSNEVASLLTFIRNDNEHLVKLLASFEIHSNGQVQYYLLFPWADGTLWDFWKEHDEVECRFNLSKWMSDQCYLLANALQIFHNERRNQLRIPDGEIEEDQEELFGRHGDIKAENILWFKKQSEELDQLVLNDFGLARLHSKISRSMQAAFGMPRTETYRAPEFDIPNGTVTRTSDIFSLGCAFLEFVTWFLEGFDAADVEFVDARSEPDPHDPNFKLDTFFKIVEESGTKVPVIKKQVKDWIQRLRDHQNCTHYINDFLDLIEQNMLDPNPKQRYESSRVVNKLKVLRQACHSDTTYWEVPIHVHS
ncbi:uncharacterized protein PG986_005200 [Apiospora aurea]|uniref:Protein kinase domain-containing protein n=1 Tax=Apiospora aurea TaxID=335848 RepID=A0ABR1QH74_9PEZI